MQHSDFSIGKEFLCGQRRWRCTDVGTRTIVAIVLDHDDPSWEIGPPYARQEVVFDEYDLVGCTNVENQSEDIAESGYDFNPMYLRSNPSFPQGDKSGVSQRF
jgi:hypothetical protein